MKEFSYKIIICKVKNIKQGMKFSLAVVTAIVGFGVSLIKR